MDDKTRRLPSPAEFVRGQLDARGMTQIDLAFVLGVHSTAVSQIALGRRGVSAEMAKALGEAFEVPPEEILRMQKAAEVEDELRRAKDPDPSVARKARLTRTYPLREMIKRGWISDDVATIEAQVARFFGSANVGEIPHLDHAAKKTSYVDNVPPAQLAWLFRVKQIACRLVVRPYSEKALRDALPKLRALMRTPEAARAVPQLLAEAGIRLVLVENMPGAKIDGVCFWLNDGSSPVVGMSMRFDRIDNFWFVLRHELEHVLRRDGTEAVHVDVDLAAEVSGDPTTLPEEERLANEAASDFAIPKAKMDSFVARKAPFFSENDLVGFATIQGVHPGIAAGQLRHRTRNYRLFTPLLAKIRFALLPTAVVDGWGETYPIGEGK